VTRSGKPAGAAHPEDVARYAEAFKQLLEVATMGEDTLALLQRITAEIRRT
jgi:hypothetical protein